MCLGNMISIFTPAYNRAHLLPRLYKSLKKQQVQNFEWIIVDDGSTDNTREIVRSFMAENKISIWYHQKINEGKHLAINKGVELANGDLFFIVDSDDYLTEDATLKITEYYETVKNKNDFAGISFRRGINTSQYIGTQKFFEPIEANCLDFRFRYYIKGDMAEVYKTSVMREFPFPRIEGEKFCTEGLVWNRMALKYKLLWISEIIYIGEYLEDGLSYQSFQARRKSPKYATLYYSELTTMSVSYFQKLRAAINYWRFARFLNISFADKWKKVSPVLSIMAIPMSWLFLIKDKL